MKRFLVVALLFASSVDGQQPAAPAPEPTTVSWVRGSRPARKVHLGDEICVGVTGFETLRKAAAAIPKPVTLYLNGIDSKLQATGEGCSRPNPTLTPEERKADMLTFRLERTADNKDLWRNLLRDPIGESTEPVTFSIGISEDKAVNAGGGKSTLTLQKYDFTAGSVFWIVLVLLIIVLLFVYASDMLRNGPPIDKDKQAFSLGRSQMAWWFVLIIASYITIWLITGDGDTITTSLLVLMGISAATAMGSVAIEVNAPARADDQRRELEQEKKSLETSEAAMPAAAARTAEEQAAMEAIKMRKAEINQTVANITKPPITTGSWLRDILTDNSGTVGLHRFQIVAWTVVLGCIFVVSVARDLSMPEFNTTLLALMGISAGTYLGFKLPTNGG